LEINQIDINRRRIEEQYDMVVEETVVLVVATAMRATASTTRKN
jgi:hypothetical protein